MPAGSAPIPTTTIPVPGMGNVDITQALAALLPPPPNPLLGVKLSSATASGSCVNGKPTLTGSSHVLGLTVAGQELPVDQAVSQAVTAIGGGTLDPSQLTSQPLPAPLNQIPLATLQPLLDALPAMAIPPTVAQIRVTPGSQTVQNGTLTQKGLQIFVALGGQTVADLTLGQASVSQGDVGCAQPVAAAQLQCTTRKLALIDVLERKGYARLYGAADRTLIGKRVNVVASWNGKTVARPVVRKDGTFLAKGKLPPMALRHSNRARYQAKIGKERSLRLKLFRRMLVTELSSRRARSRSRGTSSCRWGRRSRRSRSSAASRARRTWSSSRCAPTAGAASRSRSAGRRAGRPRSTGSRRRCARTTRTASCSPPSRCRARWR